MSVEQDQAIIVAVTIKLTGRNLVVDGSDSPDPETSVFDSDPEIGHFPPFVVFDIEAQEFIGPNCDTREQAEEVLRDMLLNP